MKEPCAICHKEVGGGGLVMEIKVCKKCHTDRYAHGMTDLARSWDKLWLKMHDAGEVRNMGVPYKAFKCDACGFEMEPSTQCFRDKKGHHIHFTKNGCEMAFLRDGERRALENEA